jgi:mono/diheme cytochrome c family protein
MIGRSPPTMRRLPLLSAAALLALAACGAADDREPTWFGGVQALVNHACAACHGAEPLDERIAGFRLDRSVAGDDFTLDAHDFLAQIRSTAVLGLAPAMPLTGEISDADRDLLDRWVQAGGPKGVRDNQPPTALMTAPAAAPAQVDQSLALTVTSADADDDGLLMAIEARDLASGEVATMASGLGAGTYELALDTGQLASGRDVELLAIVDDGYDDDPARNRHEITLVPTLRVDHGARGTAPSVRLLEPNGGATLIGDATIAWSASDPDAGDTLTFDLDLLRMKVDGSTTVIGPIVHGLTGVSTHVWDTSAVPATDAGGPIGYAVRVTATDRAANLRSDDSDSPFTVAAMTTTTLTWADVKPTFITFCKGCHGQPARSVALEDFRLDKYDAADPEPPANGDLGVYEMRAQVYQRLVVATSMPPAGAPQPTAADRARIGEWISAGAPRGGGSGDNAPVIVWTTPNDSAVVRTSATGAITLAWSASDPEGEPLTGEIAFARLQATADQTAFCDGALAGWAALPVDVAAGSYAWTAPATDYYCLRATATDPGGHTTVRIAQRPVKYRTTGP